MKPAPFEYHRPASLDEAVALLAELGDEARPLAGGQSLVPMLALRLARPAHVIDLDRVDELTQVDVGPTGLRLGSMVRQRTVETSAEMTDACPLLAQAIPNIGHVPIRTRGTVGGSLAHADPVAELPAVASALEAQIVLRSVRGERVVEAGDFFIGHFTTMAAPDELLTEVRFPTPGRRSGTSFAEMSRRPGDFAIVGAAAVVTTADDGTIATAALSLCGVGPTPVRLTAAEKIVIGQPASLELFRDAMAAAAADLDPPNDLHGTAAYRRRLAAVLGERVLTAAATDAARKEIS